MPIWMTSDGTTPVSLIVLHAPPRTVSGGLQYSTDTGFGVRGAWENRNLFGGGEQLRVTAPISEDSQSLNASFRKPAFGIRDQALVGEAWAIKETTDAYDQSALSFAAGLERRFRKDWRNWWASARVSVEAGSLKDNYRAGGRTACLVFPCPCAGIRPTARVEPDHRDAGDPRGDAVYGHVQRPSDHRAHPAGRQRLLVSGVGSACARRTRRRGSLTGENVRNIPASLRFYSGGGGSVRGYKYQSLGPHTERRSARRALLTDVSLEARFRITESFGIVPFVDGGMVRETTIPSTGAAISRGAWALVSGIIR